MPETLWPPCPSCGEKNFVNIPDQIGETINCVRCGVTLVVGSPASHKAELTKGDTGKRHKNQTVNIKEKPKAEKKEKPFVLTG
jgi:rRNA maturation protein Nop10